MRTTRTVDRVLIAAPAHDEQTLIVRAIDAMLVAAQRAREVCGLEVSIAIAAHRCTDDTFGVAARALSHADGIDITVLRDEVSHSVGGVRRRLIGAVAGQWNRPKRCWLLSTDADSIVPPDWITSMLSCAERTGAVAVAGMTDLVDWNAPAHARAAYEAIIAAGLTDDGGHRHAYAANLAVRLDAYFAAGGFPSVEHGEEHALLRAIAARGGVVATPRQPRVRTSGRMPGRAAHGLGDLLASLPALAAEDALTPK